MKKSEALADRVEDTHRSFREDFILEVIQYDFDRKKA
jgi:hypothetical protein